MTYLSVRYSLCRISTKCRPPIYKVPIKAPSKIVLVSRWSLLHAQTRITETFFIKAACLNIVLYAS